MSNIAPHKYDFFIAGRWRNKDAVKSVLGTVRAAGKLPIVSSIWIERRKGS